MVLEVCILVALLGWILCRGVGRRSMSTPTMNVSFAGCGFLGIYHVGVACCFKKYAPHLLVDKIAGASAGAIAACSLLCDLPIGEMVSDVLRVIHNARKRTLGPFSPSFNVQSLLLEGLDKFLPADAHRRVSGKLRVSLTRAYDLKNVIITDFNTREELLEVLLASSWVPIFSGLIPPKFRGTRYMDGGLSDNLPTLDENTITVSPFCGESDICPRDLSSQLFHVYLANTSIELSSQNASRFTRILFPPDPETLSGLCKQGFDDALRFLHRHNMLACMRCVSVQSTYVVSPNEDNCEYDPECEECKEHRKEAMVAKVPESVMTVFQDAIDAANRGLVNWLFRHRSMKILSFAVLPYILPFEIAYVTCTKAISCTPMIIRAIIEWVQCKLERLVTFVEKVDQHRRNISNQIICQLDVRQFGDVNIDFNPYASKNHVNLQFKVDLHGEKVKTLGDKILSRRSSLVMTKAEDGPEDTVDNILKVTQHNDAVLAFYYMDGENKVQVTEIFEVTHAESESIFPNDSMTEVAGEETERDGSEVSAEAGPEDPDGMFSDPESEWKEPGDWREAGSDVRSEAEQRRHSMHTSS